ncbi:MAG: dihydrodipicolinate synthase family protein [SAR202 cluster bacterium]|nr:dihydrodipicolinate synthase family protein [SAR202 cluster bacterium]MDP6513603.1 dihydrodipicolinate synthase family protein [SAR202 cluster bacterium]MDP6715920.1 dihydrodipicolinate synthase family protein [SAR202 cluster bacterium]
MVDRTMTGFYPILSMPFDDQGRIDVEDLQKEVDFCIEGGAHGLGIAMASEIYKLSEAERDIATTTVVEQSAGRAKVVINTGAQGSDLTILYSLRAQELGADATMITPPTLMGATSNEIRSFYKRVSDAIDIPIFIQDIGNAQVPPPLAAQIAKESENACYAKVEVAPVAPRVAEAHKLGGDDLIIFGGAGGNFFIEELRRGAVGTMPFACVPEMFRNVWDLYHDGKEDEAIQDFDKHLPLLKTLGQGMGIANYLGKEVLRLRGVFKTVNVRHPATPPDDQTFNEIRRIVERLELAPASVA